MDKERLLDNDTKVYNLYQKYLKYKYGNIVERSLNYKIYNKSNNINVKQVEKLLRIKRLKKRISSNLKKETILIQQHKHMYGKYYTDDVVNIRTLSDTTFNNIINNGNDDVSTFSIDYDFTKAIFGLTQNNIIFEIQDGMYEFLTKEDDTTKKRNIELIYKWIDEMELYNTARKYCIDETSSKYNTKQKKNKLLSIKNEELKKKRFLVSKGNNEDKLIELDKVLRIIDYCLDNLDNKNFNRPINFKANLLLELNIININSLDTAIKIVTDSKLKNEKFIYR